MHNIEEIPRTSSVPPPATRALRPISGMDAGYLDRARATSRLVAGILHEFNTPLGALCSAIDTARGGLSRLSRLIDQDPERARRLVVQLDGVLGIAREASERIRDTVEALSHFARVDRADVDHVDVPQLIDTALRLSGATRNKSLRIVRSVPAALVVRCRVREIEHVLYHVLRNANEAVAGCADPRIEVSVEADAKDPDVVRILVSDTGAGIDPEKLPTIFEPVLTTKGSTVGLGLSMATCRHIAQEHGGGLAAENLPDGGARFVFWFRAIARAGR